jgi:hypothetical protein
MLRPPCQQGFACAVQQARRNLASSIAKRASRVSWGRSAIVLLGAVLLCGASALREFEISIRDRRVEGSASTIRVKRGETVLLRWRTDEAVSLHVHGYDVQANLSAASPTSMRFEAGVAGRFPITAHEFGAAAGGDARPKTRREVTLLYLEVLPE